MLSRLSTRSFTTHILLVALLLVGDALCSPAFAEIIITGGGISGSNLGARDSLGQYNTFNITERFPDSGGLVLGNTSNASSTYDFGRIGNGQYFDWTWSLSQDGSSNAFSSQNVFIRFTVTTPETFEFLGTSTLIPNQLSFHQAILRNTSNDSVFFNDINTNSSHLVTLTPGANYFIGLSSSLRVGASGGTSTSAGGTFTIRSITAVPEPSSALLASMGIAALLWYRQKGVRTIKCTRVADRAVS